MIGAIVGDVIGAPYEFNNIKTTEFDIFNKHTNFTDDTVMLLANAKWLLDSLQSRDKYSIKKLEEYMVEFGEKYPYAGYGGMFCRWLFQYESFVMPDGKRATKRMPYNSYGNGSAMRVIPVGWAFDTLDETLQVAKISAEITHNHIEGIKGAQATAAAIFLAKEYVEWYSNMLNIIGKTEIPYLYDDDCLPYEYLRTRTKLIPPSPVGDAEI